MKPASAASLFLHCEKLLHKCFRSQAFLSKHFVALPCPQITGALKLILHPRGAVTWLFRSQKYKPSPLTFELWSLGEGKFKK